jgi:hypothetical protein
VSFAYDDMGDPVHTDGPHLIGLPLQGLMIAPLSFELLSATIEEDPQRRFWPAGLPRHDGEELFIKLSARVLHRDTAEPVTIQFGKAIQKEYVERSPDYLAAMLREALREMMAHEIDEMLLRDGVRIREPHPERR